MAGAEDHPEAEAAADEWRVRDRHETIIRSLLVAVALAVTGTGSPPSSRFRRLPFDSNADLLSFRRPSTWAKRRAWRPIRKGDIFLYTRTGNPTMTLGTSRAVSHGGSRLFQFDRSGKFVREIGQGAYGLLQAQQVRVDPQDNIWIVDQMSTQVIKFDANGRVQMVLSRKPEAMRVPALPLVPPATGRSRRSDRPPSRAGGRGGGAPGAARRGAAAGGGRGGPLPGAGAEGESFQRPTDVAWDAPATSMWPTATATRGSPSTNRPVSTSSRGAPAAAAPGQFNIVHGIAIDAQGNVYVADEGNRRVQVFDGNGTFKNAVPERRHAHGALHHAGTAQFLTWRIPAIRMAWKTPRSTRWTWTGRSSASSAGPASS